MTVKEKVKLGDTKMTKTVGNLVKIGRYIEWMLEWDEPLRELKWILEEEAKAEEDEVAIASKEVKADVKVNGWMQYKKGKKNLKL